jgi:hypothetical protein
MRRLAWQITWRAAVGAWWVLTASGLIVAGAALAEGCRP